MRRLYLLQLQMLLMVICGVVAAGAEDVSLQDAYLMLAGSWGALGALAAPISRGVAPRRSTPGSVMQPARR